MLPVKLPLMFLINRPKWENELRAFTFISLPEDEQINLPLKHIQLIMSVTNQLLSLHAGDELIIGDVSVTSLQRRWVVYCRRSRHYTVSCYFVKIRKEK